MGGSHRQEGAGGELRRVCEGEGQQLGLHGQRETRLILGADQGEII